MHILDLFVVSSIPVLKVLLVTAVGSFLALDRINLLGEDARKHFNAVVFYVFSPSLIATNLARTVTLDSVITLWFMPLNILITFILGSAFGWIVIQLTRAPSHLRGLVLGCCAAGNLGNMLLIIIPAVCKESGSPFGDPAICHTYGMAYASLSMAIGAIYLWSYVYNLVRVYSLTNTNAAVDAIDSCKQSLLLPSNDPDQDQCHITLPYGTSNVNPKVSFFAKFKQYLKTVDEKLNLKRLFAPSTIGAIVGFVVGVVPQIKRLLIGESAPLRVIQDSASLLSDGAVPVLTLIIGGNLLRGLQGSKINKSLIVGIVVVRYVLLPISGILTVKAAIALGLIKADPLYQFVLLLQYALPPAMNIGTMTQLFGTGESECSVIMLWTYSLASVSLTVWSALFMWLVS